MSKKVNFKNISVHAGPETSPGFLLWRISTQWRSCIEATLKPLGLTHPQFVVLAATGWLTRDGSTISQIDVGRQAGLDPNTLSQILRGLEAKQLIERNQTSGRSKNPVLTAAGAKLVAQALPAVEAADAQFFAKLSPNESANFIVIAQKLASA